MVSHSEGYWIRHYSTRCIFLLQVYLLLSQPKPLIHVKCRRICFLKKKINKTFKQRQNCWFMLSTFTHPFFMSPSSPSRCLLYFILSVGHGVSWGKQLLPATTYRCPVLSVVSRALWPSDPSPSDCPCSHCFHFLTSHPTPIRLHTDFISAHGWRQPIVGPLSLHLAHSSLW